MRTFLALDINDAILDRVAESERRIDAAAGKIRWVARTNLHVTLNFLGDLPDEKLSSVCDVAAEVASAFEPFDFGVEGILAVPPGGRLRMFWAGVEDRTGRLVALQAELAKSLSALGLPEENRRFRPHVTLARIRSTRDRLSLKQAAEPFIAEEFGVQHADEVVVYSSRLTPQGSIYTPVAHARFAPAT